MLESRLPHEIVDVRLADFRRRPIMRYRPRVRWCIGNGGFGLRSHNGDRLKECTILWTKEASQKPFRYHAPRTGWKIADIRQA